MNHHGEAFELYTVFVVISLVVGIGVIMLSQL